MTALETAISLKTTQQDFLSCKGWALRFMHFKGYTIHQSSTSARNFHKPTCHVKGWMPENVMAKWQKKSLGQMTKCFY